MERTCIHFKGDRPCKPYWNEKLYENGLNCSKNCSSYKKIGKRILLIKLDAVGDVLRSTPLAEGIKKQFPNSQLTWLVAESGVSILKNNPYIDRLLTYNSENINGLMCEYFDILINLDKDKRATFLTNKIRANEKRGYLLGLTGTPFPINKGANLHYQIALDNWGKKNSNTKSFQELIFDIAEIPYNNEEYFLKLDEEYEKFAEDFRKKFLKKNLPVVGIVTGCGPVYPHKKWHKEGIIELIKKLKSKKIQVVLFGGKGDIEINKEIEKKTGAINEICNTSLPQFAALVKLCDVFFTGDTFGLHVAIAFKKPVISVFGPTPAQEIRIDKGKKLIGRVHCLNCYDQFPCIMEKNKKPNCMQTITSNEVFEEIMKFIK